MNDNIMKIWNIIYSNIIPIVLFCSIFIEIVPVKFNPLSAFVEWLFSPVNKRIKELEDKFDDDINNIKSNFNENISQIKEENAEIKKLIKQIEINQDKRRFATIRWEVLEFANSIQNGSLHTYHEYQYIHDIVEEYNDLHAKYKELSNGYLDDAIKDINVHYDEHKNQNIKYF